MEATISPTRDDRIRDFHFDLDQLVLELVRLRHPELQRPDGSWPEDMMGMQDEPPPVGRARLQDA